MHCKKQRCDKTKRQLVRALVRPTVFVQFGNNERSQLKSRKHNCETVVNLPYELWNCWGWCESMPVAWWWISSISWSPPLSEQLLSAKTKPIDTHLCYLTPTLKSYISNFFFSFLIRFPSLFLFFSFFIYDSYCFIFNLFSVCN